MTTWRITAAWRPALVSLSLLGIGACAATSPYAGGEPNIHAPQPNFPVRQDTVPGYTSDTQVAATAPSTPVQPPPASPPTPVVQPPAPLVSPPVSSATIETQNLPDLTPPPAAPPPPPPAPVVAQPAPPPPAPAPVAAPQPTFRTIATGPVVETEGPPQRHTVKRGETLSSIARAMNTTVSFLTEHNHLRDPSAIRPGQRLNGPATRGKAYVVQSGDTLAAISRRFSVSQNQLVASNTAAIRTVIRPGQRIMLPHGYRDVGPQQIADNGAAPPPPGGVSSPAPSTNTYQRATQTPQVAAAAPAAPTAPIRPIIPRAPSEDLVALAQGRFVWPVEGQVVGGYGARGVGQQSNGLSIAAAEGTGVRASADGTVLYAGADAPDFGKVVLIDHANGFVTTYAHLSRIDVREDETVRQNQVIGLVGQTGAVSEPQLYFEIRRRATQTDTAAPLDPTPLLPRR